MCVLLITLSTQLNSTIIYCFVDLYQANSVINSSQTIFLAIFIEYIFEISAWIYFIISSEWAFFSCHPITTLHHLERKKKVFNAANFWTQKLFIPSSSTPQTLKKRVKNCIWQKCKLKNKLKVKDRMLRKVRKVLIDFFYCSFCLLLVLAKYSAEYTRTRRWDSFTFYSFQR